MSEGNILKLRLSLMGRPVRSYTFDKPVVTVGRDPGSDIHVDNPGVSRDHFRFEVTPDGAYQVVDLGSANGTFVNEQMVNTCSVKNNDVVRFGKYTLWVGYERDRRSGDAPKNPSPTSEKATVVLSRGELDHLIEVQKDRDTAPPTPPSVVMRAPTVTAVGAPKASAGAPPTGIAGLMVAFGLGVTLGAVVTWLLLR